MDTSKHSRYEHRKLVSRRRWIFRLLLGTPIKSYQQTSAQVNHNSTTYTTLFWGSPHLTHSHIYTHTHTHTHTTINTEVAFFHRKHGGWPNTETVDRDFNWNILTYCYIHLVNCNKKPNTLFCLKKFVLKDKEKLEKLVLERWPARYTFPRRV